ncbi:MAG: MFS transporter, partial [Novosphingobium sp.]
VFGAISLDMFAVILAGATAMLPIYARDILLVGPAELGWLRAAPAVGAALVVGAGWMLLGRASWLGQLRRGLGVALLLLALGLGARAMGVI